MLVVDHYFSGTPSSADLRRDIIVTIWGEELTFTTAGGVFSTNGLDRATSVLLRAVEPPSDAATILDLGCGWGPIACAVAHQTPEATVWAVDTNQRALELTLANAARLGVTVHASLPDDVPPHVRFDEIWSNPPIRIGKQALHDLLLRWLARLNENGTAYLVVGKDLGADSLQRWLTEQGHQTARLTTQKGFRVLAVQAKVSA